MTEQPELPPESRGEQFARQATGKSPGLLPELIDFLRYNKKWWLAPILVMLLMVTGFAFLVIDSPVTAPVLYALF